MNKAIQFVALLLLTLSGHASSDTTHSLTIPLSGSAYTTDKGGTKIYFLTEHPGPLQIAIRARSPHQTALLVKLDDDAKDTEIRIAAGNDYTTIPAGSFNTNTPGYHFISITSAGSNKSLPDIPDLVLSGPAAEGARCNTSKYRGAPSTHLTYTIPGDSAAAWFYTEVSVPEIADHSPNAYYETNGFSGGYMGIQLNSEIERRVIFSIWSNYKTDDPSTIPAEYAVRLIKKGKDVFTGDFGNEGSGGHSHLVFMWKPATTYKMLINAKPAGDHTIYTAWYFAPENRQWRLVAQWDKTKTGGKLLSGLYSFVENFGDNGQDYFTARYGHQWICTPSGNWIELTKARFTTTADPIKHPRFDYGAGITQLTSTNGQPEDWFYMYSGGFRQVNDLPRGSFLTRKPGGTPPQIDFTALPDK
jgi:hypothetical protein